MRGELAAKFDKILVIDLHGSANKGERAPDGSPDENVFDIMQGVALLVLVKTSENRQNAEILKYDIFGRRKDKYAALHNTDRSGVKAAQIDLIPPHNLFQPFAREFDEYDRSGISIDSLFRENLSGVVSGSDKRFVGFEKDEIKGQADKKRRFLLRPLDHRVINYDARVLQRARYEIMRHVIGGQNFAMIAPRQGYEGGGASIADCVTGHKTFSAYNRNYFFPLYLYPDEKAAQKDALAPTERTLNLDPKLYAQICEAAGIDPADTDMAREKALSLEGEGGATNAVGGVGVRRSDGAEPPPPTPPQGEGSKASFRAATGDARPSEVKVFDYIYGVLHSPDYRETFAEFLKIDFPRVPYPASPDVFAHVSEKGEALRRLHLMEAPAIGDTPFPFDGEPPEDTPNEVAARHPRYHDGKVFINGKGDNGQYFADVPETAWNFYIGGYQPAQKWLKDRKGRSLSFDDIRHYQSIIKILIETDRIMGEIELPLENSET